VTSSWNAWDPILNFLLSTFYFLISAMKTPLVFLLLALSLVSSAFADTVKFPEDKPFASITFPEGWDVSVSADAIAAKSEDGAALVDVIITRPDMLGPSNDKAFALLKVKPEFDSFKESDTTVNGMKAHVVNVDCRDASGKTMKLTLTSPEVTKEKGLMFIQRGEGSEKHKDEIAGILNSVTAEK
jgi:hypothetical protein